MMLMHFDPEKMTVGVLGAFLGVLIVQTAIGPINHGEPGDIFQEGEPCIGEPIVVEYAYDYRMVEPHACKPQCADGKPRYIQYTNGYATQCEPPPGCNDWGEDRRVTCILPGSSESTASIEKSS